MADTKPPPSHPPTIDPDNVPEIVCDGGINVHAHGNLATITFTHQRPAASALIDKGDVKLQSIVRARIVVTLDNLVALRELLNRIIQENPPAGTQVH